MMEAVAIPSIFANSGSGVNWSNVSNAADTAGDGATITLASGEESAWLSCTGFDFDMPDGSRITGFEPMHESESSLLSITRIHRSNIIFAGVIGAINGLLSPIVIPLVFALATAGGQNKTLMAIDIIDKSHTTGTDFGVAIRAENTGGLSATVKVRAVKLKAHYVPIKRAINPVIG